MEQKTVKEQRLPTNIFELEIERKDPLDFGKNDFARIFFGKVWFSLFPSLLPLE